MNHELMEVLQQISDEEKAILAGRHTIQKELYTNSPGFIIDSKKMLSEGKLIDIRPHTRFIRFPKHKHNYIEIVYMCSGTTRHIINGKDEIILGSGELLFLNQHAFHEITEAAQNDIAVNFIVLPEFFDIAFEMIAKDNILNHFLISALQRDRYEIGYLHFKVAEILPIQNLMEILVWSLINHQNNNRKINQTTMGLLFLELLNYTDHMEQEKPDQYDNSLVITILKQIEESYRTASLSQIAQNYNQSISKLSRLIKRSTGYTYKELLQQKRFSKAIQLLGRSTLSIEEIIAAVGYDNTSYFYRSFRKIYGMSPKTYRKANNQ
ncbi:MAG TPA: AraC family transcriptional regulator [Firmicutes bacterium]|nr:AraC family transcriptional regulator [Bacillota bacterium]